MKLTGKFVIIGFLFTVGSPIMAASTQAGHAGNLGVGAMLGAPTGLTAKYWVNEMLAIDGAAAWHFGDDSRFQIHSDGLWHFLLPYVKTPEGLVTGYLGLGLRVLAGDHPEAGIRIPLGVSYLFSTAPLEAFGELAPVARFAPDTGASVDGGVGLRYYFR